MAQQDMHKTAVPDRGARKPDAERVKHGAPEHEEPTQGDSPSAEDARDEAHGFSQESGYASSGGPPNARQQAEAEAKTTERREKPSAKN
jgi:hypothetical protein